MNVGFVTCVELGLSCIEEVYSIGGQLKLLLTLPDDRSPDKSGRVYLDDFAAEHGVDLLKVPNVNEPLVVDQVRRRRIDWLFIIGWSQIARAAVLQAPRRGAIGAHPTLLPVGRGRAAIPWTILKGLTETGVTLFKLDEGVDSGPIIAQERISVHERETATGLYRKVVAAHRALIRRNWGAFARGDVPLRPQDHARATYWPGRKPEDGRIEASMGVAEVDRLIRATTRPYPGAFFDREDVRVRVWAGCVDGGGEGAWPISVRDGTYWATDFDLEPLDASS